MWLNQKQCPLSLVDMKFTESPGQDNSVSMNDTDAQHSFGGRGGVNFFLFFSHNLRSLDPKSSESKDSGCWHTATVNCLIQSGFPLGINIVQFSFFSNMPIYYFVSSGKER